MTLNALQTLASSAVVIYFGLFLKKHFRFIDKYNLPTPVVGGFLVAFVLAFLRSQNIFEVTFDKSLQDGLMIAFFSSVGYAASFRLLKEGGRAVIFFLGLTVMGLLVQILAGLGVAKLMGLPPLMGVLTGAVALTGGPGTALAFGPAFESAGVMGASTLGLTAAMGGILLGGLVGAPLATFLIHRKKLSHPHRHDLSTTSQEHDLRARSGHELPLHFLALVLIMGLGTALSTWITDQGITLPIYIGSMIVAAVIRNIEDFRPTFQLQADWIEEIGSVALSFFIAMAVVTLKFEELRHAALPLFIFLFVQVILVVITALGPGFWVGGGDYQAAVMSSGYVGFMMGTTANAMANMTSLKQKYGAAPKAFLVVPLVGSCFIDFINAALITLCLNFFAGS